MVGSKLGGRGYVTRGLSVRSFGLSPFVTKHILEEEPDHSHIISRSAHLESVRPIQDGPSARGKAVPVWMGDSRHRLALSRVVGESMRTSVRKKRCVDRCRHNAAILSSGEEKIRLGQGQQARSAPCRPHRRGRGGSLPFSRERGHSCSRHVHGGRRDRNPNRLPDVRRPGGPASFPQPLSRLMPSYVGLNGAASAA